MAARKTHRTTRRATCAGCGHRGRTERPAHQPYLCRTCEPGDTNRAQDDPIGLFGGRWVLRGAIHHWEAAA